MRQATLPRAVGGNLDDTPLSGQASLDRFESPPKPQYCVPLGVPLDLSLTPGRSIANRDDAFPHRCLGPIIEPGFHVTEGMDQAGFLPRIGPTLKFVKLVQDAREVTVDGDLQGRRGTCFEISVSLLDLIVSVGRHGVRNSMQRRSR